MNKKNSLLQNLEINQQDNIINSNFDESAPRIFGSDDEELKYVNDYFDNKANNFNNQKKSLVLNSDDKAINPANPKYKPITITKKERLVIVQSIRYNDNYVMPFIADERVIKSLHEKGFIEQNDETELFSVKRNVCLLFEIEGSDVFDEIIDG